MVTNILYILLTALRDRLFIVLICAVVFATLISGALAGTSLVESREMTLAFSAATSRLILVLGMTVFIAFHLRYAFDNREIEVMLSRPFSRPQLVFSYWLGFSLISLFMGSVAIVVIYIASPIDMLGFASWSISLIMELWFVSAIAIFTSLMLNSAVASVLTTLAIYLLSRMMGYFLNMLGMRSLFDEPWLNVVSHEIIEKLSIIVPRLDFFAKSEWLIYGISNPWQEIMLFSTQAVIYIPILILVAIVDFYNREF